MENIKTVSLISQNYANISYSLSAYVIVDKSLLGVYYIMVRDGCAVSLHSEGVKEGQ